MFTNVHSVDRYTLLITGLMGVLSNHLDGVNLTLAIAAKLVVIGNFSIYVIINWKRIYINFKALIYFFKQK